MSDIATTEEMAVEPPRARILVYSDDVTVREAVRFAVGSAVGGRTVRWTETATHASTVAAVESKDLDLLILDGEAAKVGGMGICRQLKHEIFHCPKVLLLVGRADDAWLATWSEADGVVAHPLDPFEVQAAVADLVEPADARSVADNGR